MQCRDQHNKRDCDQRIKDVNGALGNVIHEDRLAIRSILDRLNRLEQNKVTVQGLSSNYYSRTCVAGETLSGHMVVIFNNGRVYKFNPSNEDHYLKIVGITRTSGILDGNIDVVIFGNVFLNGWGLTQNDIYYAVSNGQISNVLPTTGILQPIGIAIDSNNLEIVISNPIIIT